MVLQTLRDTHAPRYGELSSGGKTSIVPSLSSSRANYNSFDSNSSGDDDLDHGSIHSRMSTFSRTSMGENHEMSDFKGELLRQRHRKTRSETDKMFFANLARENKKLDEASCADSFAEDTDDLSDLGEEDNCPFQVISTHKSNEKIPPLGLFSSDSPPGSFEDDEDDTADEEEEDPGIRKGHRHTSSAPVLAFGEFGIKRTNSNDSKSSSKSRSSRGPSHGTMWVKSPETGAKKHLELNFSPDDIGSLSFAPNITGTPSTVSLSSMDTSPSRSSKKKTNIPGTPEGKKKGHRHRRTASRDFSLAPTSLPPSGKEHLPPSGKSKSHRRMDSDFSQSSVGGHHRRMDSDFSQSSLASLHALHVTNIIESEEGEEIELSWDRAPREPPGQSRRTRSKSPAVRSKGVHSRSSSPSYSPSGRRRKPGSHHHRRTSSIELPKASIIIPRVPNLDSDDRSGDGSLPPKPEKPPMPNRPQAHKRTSKGRRRNSAV